MTNVWDLPLWAWREYVKWLNQHTENSKKIATETGVHCVGCY